MSSHSPKVIQVIFNKQTGEVYDIPRYLTKEQKYTKDINQARVVSVCGRMRRTLEYYRYDPQYDVVSVDIVPRRV